MEKKLYRLTPAYKDYLWGGNELAENYHKDFGGKIIAESWELSTHPDGVSEIENEPLDQFIEKHPEVLGTKCKGNDIPILIKYIDAAKALSIQVHPEDEYARRVEHDNGKTEMWYIVDAKPGAFLYLGLNKSMDKETFAQHIKDHTLLDDLKKVPVKKGDSIVIRAGTIHAIAEGCLIMEIQERSNVTYRVYDFGRKDKDGNERPLHIDKALQVAKLEPADVNLKPEITGKEDETGRSDLLHTTEYFKVGHVHTLTERSIHVTEDSFMTLLLVHGNAEIICGNETVQLKQGESVFVPAGNTDITVKGNCDIITAEL